MYLYLSLEHQARVHFKGFLTNISYFYKVIQIIAELFKVKTLKSYFKLDLNGNVEKMMIVTVLIIKEIKDIRFKVDW